MRSIALAVALVLGWLSSVAADPAPGSAGAGFEAWSELARSRNISPAVPAPGDLVHRWTGADGRPVSVVVRKPVAEAGSRAVTVTPPAEGVDARPAFEEALRRLRSEKARRLVVTRGTYHFLAVETDAHLVLDRLEDVTIEGNGAIFVFHENKPGLLIRSSSRVLVRDLDLRFALETATVMRAIEEDGRRALIDVAAKDPAAGPTRAITYVAPYDVAAGNWIKGGNRLIFSPTSGVTFTRSASGAYHSEKFAPLRVGDTYMVFHNWYGGSAILVDDGNQKPDSNDLVFDRISFANGPGMGVVVYRMGRGVAIVNSRFRAVAGGSPVSTLFDAIHVLFSKGDIVVADNLITNQGDDAVNLSMPIQEIVAVAPLDGDRQTVEVSNHPKTLSPGDRLAVFDRTTGVFLGTATASSTPVTVTNRTSRLVIESRDLRLAPGQFLRNLSFSQGRFVIAGNVVEKCNCHALLAQIPNGLIENNRITDINFNAFRLITNIGQWREGVGAFNQLIRGNVIDRTGPDKSFRFPFGVISAYGVMQATATEHRVNDYIEVTGNTISNYMENCISIASSDHIKVMNNRCNEDSDGRNQVLILRTIDHTAE